MAYNVRVTTYRGIRNTEQVLPKQFSSDSVFMRDDPYISTQIVVVSSVAAASVPQAADDGSVKMMVLEVPDGQAVRYEINLQGSGGSTARIAGAASPKATGIQPFLFNQGASISLIDAAALP